MTVSQKGGQNCVPKGSAVKNNNIIIIHCVNGSDHFYFSPALKEAGVERNQSIS